MVPNTIIATKPPITIMVATAAKRQRLVSFIAFNIIINNDGDDEPPGCSFYLQPHIGLTQRASKG
jgi:hypothetical protein